MPDTMIGFRAHENDLELIEFVAGQLERIEAMLPVQIRSRGLSRQDVLRHCLVATASRYREGLDSQSQTHRTRSRPAASVTRVGSNGKGKARIARSSARAAAASAHGRHGCSRSGKWPTRHSCAISRRTTAKA